MEEEEPRNRVKPAEEAGPENLPKPMKEVKPGNWTRPAEEAKTVSRAEPADVEAELSSRVEQWKRKPGRNRQRKQQRKRS